MKIAIYHNLEKGGALKLLTKIASNLSSNNEVDIYCHKKNIGINNAKYFVYEISKTNNIFEHLNQIKNELLNINIKIAEKITRKNYDIILVFQCILTQAPYLLKYLDNNKTLYFLNEPKREFYEKTGYSHNNIKQILARLIRHKIKSIDKTNTSFAKNIITCSYFSSNQINKIYKKSSYVVYPGMIKISPEKHIVTNSDKLMTIGPFQKIKGHEFTLNQILNLVKTITILGGEGEDEKYINKSAQQKNITILRYKSYSDETLSKMFKLNSIFLANNEHEPFGIATLEAVDKNLFVIGKNEAGTSEILDVMNGTLYKDNLSPAKVILAAILKKRKLVYMKTCKIDWEHTVHNILTIIKYVIGTNNA